jgi:hypothetical protein
VLVIFLLVLFNGFLTFFAQLFIRSRAVVVEEEAAKNSTQCDLLGSKNT